MREILFRGKRLDNGEWVYGGFSHDVPYTCRLCPDDDKKEFIVTGCECFVVKGNTVGQYTGLTDKNGVKIFDGDIVKLKDYHGKRTVYIFWGNCGVWCYGGDGYSDEYIFNAQEKCEVIGNIHDNSELLQEKTP